MTKPTMVSLDKLGHNIPSADNLSLPSFTDDNGENCVQEFGVVLNEIKDYLTEEERLCVAIFKNSNKKKQNSLYQAMFKKHHNIILTSSAITRRKIRIIKVLRHVGEFLRYKRKSGIDALLMNTLTKKQYFVLSAYEKREKHRVIQKRLNLRNRCSVSRIFNRMIIRLHNSNNDKIKRYLELLSNVLKFSRKRNIQ